MTAAKKPWVSERNKVCRQWLRTRGHATGPRTTEGLNHLAAINTVDGAQSKGFMAARKWVQSLRRLLKQLNTKG